MNQTTQQPDDPTTQRPNDPTTQRPLSPAGVFWYSIASLGCGMFFSFNNAAFTLYLEDYTKNVVLQGLMASSHSVEGAIIQPIVGVLSDRSRSRLGRRRPFMLLFIPLTALLMILTPVAAQLGTDIRLPAIIACIFLFTVFFNIAFDPYQALMPDITPVRQRGRVTAFWSLLGVLGQASILLMPFSITAKFYIVAGILLVTVLLTCWKTREPHPDTLERVDRNPYAEAIIAFRGLRTLRQAARGLTVFFLSGIGVGAVLPYLTKFVKHITHCTNEQAMLMFFILMISTAVSVLPMGKLTDRFGAKRILLWSLGLVAFAAVNGLWVTTLPQIAVIMAIAGVGNAAQSAASYPLMTQLVPAEEVGFYTGLQTMALSILQPAAVIVSGIMLQQDHYRFVFGLLAVTTILAYIVLIDLSRDAALTQIDTRNREMGRAT